MKYRMLVMLVVLIGTIGCQGTMNLEEFGGDAGGPDAGRSPSGAPADSYAPSTSSPPTRPSPMVDAGMAPDMARESDAENPGADEPDMGMPDVRPEPGSIVEFRIPEGTGGGDWNSREEPVVVYVGQILRLVNEDSRDHQLHAGDDAAVDHGNRLVPGQSQDLEVERPMELGDNPRLYDHNDGRSAAFWLEARQ